MPNPNLYLYANYNRNSWRYIFQLICFSQVYWPEQGEFHGLPTLTVLPWFQCKSHSLMATQANLMGSPFRYVNIYRCHAGLFYTAVYIVEFLYKNVSTSTWSCFRYKAHIEVLVWHCLCDRQLQELKFKVFFILSEDRSVLWYNFNQPQIHAVRFRQPTCKTQ